MKLHYKVISHFYHIFTFFINDYLHIKQLDVICHPCPNISGNLTKPLSKFCHGWVIPSLIVFYRCNYLSMPSAMLGKWSPGPWFNIKMSSYQYRKSHCGDKTVVRSSYLHNGISYTGKMTSLYWIRALVVSSSRRTVKWSFGASCVVGSPNLWIGL